MDREKWKIAMEEEMDSLAKNNMWDLVELPEGRSVVGCKWVFKLKRKADGSIKRYKERLVAKGYSQVEGIEFHEIFSPVVNHVYTRTMLALTALLNLELEQLDVKTTFRHGDLDEEIYMEQPESFVQDHSRRLVCKLGKSLYGLRQSPKECKSIEEINGLKAQLSKIFDMKYLGAEKHILGMEIHKDRKNGKLWLSQQKYVERVLEMFSMNNVKPVNVPLASHFKLSSVLSRRTDEEKQYMYHIPYENVVGNLMYAMVSTRRDISHVVGVFTRFMANLGDLGKRRSTIGYVFTLAGGAITWMSKLQEIVVLSTTETEYIVASDANKEAIWLKDLLDEIGRTQERVNVFCDS
eukprot:PITA_06198